MKLKFTYERAGGSAVDLIATLDSQATVGDLADFLLASDPERRRASAESYTLSLLEPKSQLLDRDLPLTDSPVGSGARLGVLPASARYSDRPEDDAAAILSILSSPTGPKDYYLPAGSTVLGRESGCDIVLDDPMISRQHVRISITDIVETHDLGSSNGTLVGSEPISRVALRPSDVVEIGDTRFTVRMVHEAAVQASIDSGASIGFIRSPFITPHFVGHKFEAPQPPERTRPTRFPIVTLFAPVIVALVLYEFTHQILSLLFMGLSPIMLVGGVLESRRTGKAEFRDAVLAYRSDLDLLSHQVQAAREQEREVRLVELPSSADLVGAARTRSPRLWSRRPGDADFLSVRAGCATMPSRSSIELPRPGRAPYELFAEAQSLADSFSVVDAVPVVASLAETGVGVAGPRRVAIQAAQSLVAQAVALHSPAELVVTCLCSGDTSTSWDWLKWLPHTSSPQSPITARHLASNPNAGGELVTDLEALVAARDDNFRASTDDPAVLLIIESDPPVDHSRLVSLAETGPRRGVGVVWVASDQTLLPAACRTFIAISADGATAKVGVVGDRVETTPVSLDLIDPTSVMELGRCLAPLVDLGARIIDSSDIPRSVSQLTALGVELGAAPAAVLERWRESASILTGPEAPAELPRRAANLRAVVGQSATGKHIIDLRVDGPHALVGGTTGSGKSELLQSWVLALASTHSPQRVNFLFVDYKGGAAFAECENLPHSIGVVTDLRPHLVRRALDSLKAELHYRERLLAKHKAKDLVQMERMGRSDTPPSLVIVVDEFAALVKEVPEFVDGVVDVAQRGRSLGLHLILATQRPAGVIKDNLRANTNLRIALRMADADDSTDVLGTPDAAFFDPVMPGRAMSKSGPKSLIPFQASYAGGWTQNEPEGPEMVVEELTLREVRSWEPPVSAVDVTHDENATDIRRLVRNIADAFEHARIPEPRKAWQPELPRLVDLIDLDLVEHDEALAFAKADEPSNQDQPTAYYRPEREPNLIVYGTSGSGKSTLLRTLAISAGFAAVSTPTQVYGLDFGSRGLSSLAVLPHVGDVIPGSDHERVARLLTMLRSVIDDRVALLSDERATTLSDYRSRTGSSLPRIFLLLDGLPAFRATYEVGDRQRWVDLLVSIMSEGRAAGVHVLLSSDQRSGLTNAMSSSVQRRIVMRMASVDDYSMLGVPLDVLDASSDAGRALDGGREVQVGVLGRNADVSAQAERMKAFAAKMVEAGVPEAPSIESLPELIALSTLESSGGEVVIGTAGETLNPLCVEPCGGFVITGPSSSGRSTVLHTLVDSGRRSLPQLEWHYLGQRRSRLATRDDWESSCTSLDETGTWADGVISDLKAYAETGRRAAIVVESAGDYVNSMAETSLQSLMRLALADGHWVVIEGEASTLGTGIGFVGIVKAARCGLALQPDADSSAIFKTPFPRTNRLDFPPGRGFYVSAGRTTLVQVAVPWEVDRPRQG